MKPKCEGCGYPATHVCSGLDVPALYFCDHCRRIHETECPDVHEARAIVTRMMTGGERRPEP